MVHCTCGSDGTVAEANIGRVRLVLEFVVNHGKPPQEHWEPLAQYVVLVCPKVSRVPCTFFNVVSPRTPLA